MTERCSDLHAVFDELAKLFPEESLEGYRNLVDQPAEAFAVVKKNFAAEVADLSSERHDINRDHAKRRLILGHTLLALFDSLKHGRREWLPVPRVQGQPWAKQETALLLWSSQHGTSDDRL